MQKRSPGIPGIIQTIRKLLIVASFLLVFGLVLFPGNQHVAHAVNTPAGCPGGGAGPVAPGIDCNNQSTWPGATPAPSPVALRATCGEATNPNYRIISQDGGSFVKFLCQGADPGRNIIEVIIERGADWLVNLSTVFFAVIIMLSVVGMGVSGASPEAIKSSKRRIVSAVTSIAAFWTARIILTITGVTGDNKILGVDVTVFNKDTIPALMIALVQHLQFVGGALSIITIIVAGIRFMTSQGNPNAIAQARKLIAYAVLTLLIVGSGTLIFSLLGVIIKGA
ncbi:hypothetical protein IT415_02645 [bacterium]|nr:hypothetical protein [bacterium]